MKGHFKVDISRNGKTLVDFDFNNMILKSGYEYILNNTSTGTSTTVINQCLLGNGRTEPKFTDTGLSGETVGVISLVSAVKEFTSYYTSYMDSYEDDIILHRHIFTTKATTFSTVSEIATAISDGSNAPVLFSKTLLRDAEGRPTQYNVGPGDDIKVTYTVLVKRNRFIDTTYTKSIHDSYRTGSKLSPLGGARRELEKWTIGTLTESASKAGCTWSIDFDTTNLAEKKTFDIIFDIAYVEGSAGYTAFLYSASNVNFKFGYTLFGSIYTVVLPSVAEADMPNERRIRIRQTYSIGDLENWFGKNLLGLNQNLRVLKVGNDLKRGEHSIEPDTQGIYNGTMLFKRFIPPYMNLLGRSRGGSAVYNGYIYDEKVFSISGTVNELVLNTYEKQQFDGTYRPVKNSGNELYCYSGKLTNMAEAVAERSGCTVNYIALVSTEYESDVGTRWTTYIRISNIGTMYDMYVSAVETGLVIKVNGVVISNKVSYYGNEWYLPIPGVDAAVADFEPMNNTLPVLPGDLITIEFDGKVVEFRNPTHDQQRYAVIDSNSLTKLIDVSQATASLHNGFYGEVIDE